MHKNLACCWPPGTKRAKYKGMRHGDAATQPHTVYRTVGRHKALEFPYVSFRLTLRKYMLRGVSHFWCRLNANLPTEQMPVLFYPAFVISAFIISAFIIIYQYMCKHKQAFDRLMGSTYWWETLLLMRFQRPNLTETFDQCIWKRCFDSFSVTC